MSNTKEIKNFLEKMFKNSAKSYGYKVISGIPYKEINGALLTLYYKHLPVKMGFKCVVPFIINRSIVIMHYGQ